MAKKLVAICLCAVALSGCTWREVCRSDTDNLMRNPYLTQGERDAIAPIWRRCTERKHK